MKNTVKCRDSSSLSRLPDEIILQILNKLIDLKTLCFCSLVSRRFSSIVLQVDAIAFTAPLINPPIPDKNTVGDVDDGRFIWMLFWLLLNGVAYFLHGMIFALSKPFPPVNSSFGDECFRFLSAITFLNKFRGIKSLSIELTSSSHIGIDNRCLFKWKVKVGNQIESLKFLSPSSVRDKDGFYLNGNKDEEEDNELPNDRFKQKCDILFQCLKDAMPWHMMLLYLFKNIPKLEKVSITDSGRRGRISLSGEKLSDVKDWLHSAWETVFNRVDIPDLVSQCYIPVLNLPVSGYVMKGVYFCLMERKDLQGGNDVLMNSENGFEDKEEAAYTEAVKEILEKHKGLMQRLM